VGKIQAGTSAQCEGDASALAWLFKQVARVVFLSDVAQAANDTVDRVRQARAMRAWEKRGRTGPPPHLAKQRIVCAYARAFGLDTLIETGTYLGAMIKGTRHTFRTIISIELDPHLYERARRKLAEPGHITILNGDSAEVLPRVLRHLDVPCLFWLDAHHSGLLTARGRQDSPVLLELQAILSHPVAGHVVLIDDAHEFVGEGGYPTLRELREMVAARRPDWAMVVGHDIIRLHARRSTSG